MSGTLEFAAAIAGAYLALAVAVGRMMRDRDRR
jgi:hypothetical protein